MNGTAGKPAVAPPEISVAMSVYNNAETLPAALDGILSQADVALEFIVVDDGSTDGTAELLRATAFDGRVRLFFHDRNRGKGAALRAAFQHVTGEVVVIQDADLEYDPAEFSEMIRPIRDGVADVVFGSRLSGGKPQRVYMFWHRVGNGFLTFLTNLLYNTTLTDMETCYKMFRSEVIRQIRIRSDDFSVEPEITAKIFKNRRLRVYEMPISYYGRTYEEGKKISWKHGIGAVAALIRYRFTD